MVEPVTDLDPRRIAARLAEVREAAGAGVEVLIATKYVPVELMGALAEAGVDVVGENRLADLEAKRERWGEAFRWDFIGALQSRKAQQIAARTHTIHSLCTESARTRLAGVDDPGRILIQVNVAGEKGKQGIVPGELGGFIAGCPFPVVGLMTMPPLARDPEESRPHFARLAELAAEHGLSELSMGTSQDWRVAVQEGATIVRLGSAVLR